MAEVIDLIDLIRRTKRVYICGNGGSAANAVHIANDLFAVGVRAHALTADIGILTATANDFDYAEIFSSQLHVYGEARDLLIALSGSGKSKNIYEALRAAKLNCGMLTCAIFGSYNHHDDIASKCDMLIARGRTMQEAEEEQIRIGHEVMIGLREGMIRPEQLTPNVVNAFFERSKIPAKCGFIKDRTIILSINEQNNAALEFTELWLKRTTGVPWSLQVQPWKWPEPA